MRLWLRVWRMALRVAVRFILRCHRTLASVQMSCRRGFALIDALDNAEVVSARRGALWCIVVRRLDAQLDELEIWMTGFEVATSSRVSYLRHRFRPTCVA